MDKKQMIEVNDYVNDLFVKYALIYLKYACKEIIEPNEHILIKNGDEYIIKFPEYDRKVSLSLSMILMDINDFISYCNSVWLNKVKQFEKNKLKYERR